MYGVYVCHVHACVCACVDVWSHVHRRAFQVAHGQTHPLCLARSCQVSVESPEAKSNTYIYILRPHVLNQSSSSSATHPPTVTGTITGTWGCRARVVGRIATGWSRNQGTPAGLPHSALLTLCRRWSRCLQIRKTQPLVDGWLAG